MEITTKCKHLKEFSWCRKSMEMVLYAGGVRRGGCLPSGYVFLF